MVTRARQKTKTILALGLTALVLGLSACERKKTGEMEGSGDGLISNRPTKAENYIAVVKLKNPALLATSGRAEGRTQIDAEQAAGIETEQKAFLEQLAQIAPRSRVIYRYRLVLNGFALTGPIADLEKLKEIAQIASYETDGGFQRPSNVEQEEQARALAQALLDRNSVKFIGAENLHRRTISNPRGEPVPLNGTGMRVGIIDTGIDYTHSMMGGPGTVEAYKSVNPSEPHPLFPNGKVVGGIDLVGTDYNAAAVQFEKNIPKPDANPMDEGGHGTHVAGTVAGLGDGVETYSGVAPGADLYAIKVFGAGGATSDSVVIAGLEYAADPNSDLEFNDQLDVVNLSLGSSFGGAKILYNEAIRNLTQGGTVVVASAGNSGNVDYITGAPGVADDAISVAASVDDTLHNWQLPAVKFITPSAGDLVVPAVEAAITKTIEQAGPVTGSLVFVGLADQDFTDEVKASLKGKVALIDRGVVPFAEKIRRSQEAGAVGVVVANNQPGDAFVMGGEGAYEIPAVMVTQAVGATLKEELGKGEVVMHFSTPDKILLPERIDTITDFSSKGPRTDDSVIKPEISAPGQNIISAAMGEGTKGVKLSGTSMAGPHIAGAMALLKQAHPTLSVTELKTLLLNGAKTIDDESGAVYPVSRQGAGRVQIDRSVDTAVMIKPATLSLGGMALESRKTVRKQITLKNMKSEPQTFELKLVKRGEGLNLRPVPALTLAAGEEKTVSVNLLLDSTGMEEIVREMDGWIIAEAGGQEVSRIPVLAVARRVSNISARNLIVEASSADFPGAAGSLQLVNEGKNAGDALLFNLIAQDSRKKDPFLDPYMSRTCDIQSVGYRVVEKEIEKGRRGQVLQVAAKMFAPLTHWQGCELTVLIDRDGDQVAEQELAAISMDNVPGLATPPNQYGLASALFDAAKLREIRKEIETRSAASGEKVEENYAPALLTMVPFTPYDHSTVVVVEAEVARLARRPTGELSIKVVSQEYSGSSVEVDDVLNDETDQWFPLSVDPLTQSYVGLPEKVRLASGETRTVEFEKGYGLQPLMVLAPQNLTVVSDTLEDRQQILLRPKFEEPQP